MSRSTRRGRRLLAPEVLQTSAMDCGPAALTCLLEGYGIRSSYAALQEACQTDLDGTSINILEELAVSLGLDADQVILPPDHLVLQSARSLPALAVVKRQGTTHFLIVWRRHGRFVQLMDPARGRRRVRIEAFREELYIHRQRVPADAWRAWAVSREFLGPLGERLAALQLTESAREQLVQRAAADRSWRSLALLDAATRMVADLVAAGGLHAGGDAGRVIETIQQRACGGTPIESLVPESYWFAVPGDTDGELVLRGAVLLRVAGPRTPVSPPTDPADRAGASRPRTDAVAQEQRPLAEMWRLVCQGRPAIPALIGLGLFVAAAGALFEVMWLRGLLEIGHVLALREQRLATLAMLLGFVGSLMVLDGAIAGAVLRIGRGVEARIRAALLDALPRLGDGYFRSRLVSDLAHRAHSLGALRAIPELGSRCARVSMQLVFTALALAWLDPPSAGLAVAAAVVGLAIPLATERVLAERELRQRSHSAALATNYLDSLVGLVSIRMHGGERPVRHQHEQLLDEWGRSSLHLLRGSVVIEGAQLLIGFLLAAWLVLGFVSRGARPGSTLLLVYWALTLPMLARELAATMRQFPAYRNILARALEPLSLATKPPPESEPPAKTAQGVAITLRNVQVRIRGRQVLRVGNLTLEPGEHVAVVGRSGAGKSTLAGLLLGWHTPAEGTVLVDGVPLDASTVPALRDATAWVDPAVQLWNRSLFDNLRYGDRGTMISNIGSIVEEAALGEILEKLPSGLQSPLGEGGRLTSGGEGQRIRFGRALGRSPVRLAVLDEPFRGLDRQQRRDLLARARRIWREQTLLCITHDIEETLAFDRVLVLEDGVVEQDGNPAALAGAEGSPYAELLDAERAVQATLWATGGWRRWKLENGGIAESAPALEQACTTKKQHSSSGR